MLNGFEEMTYELTETEKKLIPVFLRGFATKHGKNNSVTNKEISNRLKQIYPKLSINEARVRKIINYIRTKNIIPGLVATSSGYYITKDPEEIRKYIQSLSGRENEIHRVKQSFEKYLNELQH